MRPTLAERQNEERKEGEREGEKNPERTKERNEERQSPPMEQPIQKKGAIMTPPANWYELSRHQQCRQLAPLSVSLQNPIFPLLLFLAQ